MIIRSFIDSEPYQTDSIFSDFSKKNPFTQEDIHQIHSCDLLGLVRAVQSANRAFPEWKGSSIEDRIQVLEKIRLYLKENSDRIARLEAMDQGLPLAFIRESSIQSSINYLEEVKKTKPAPEFQYSPVGAVAIIASWNLSLRVILDRLIPALMAGNSVVVKVSSASPVTAHILAEIAQLLPKGLLNVLVSNDPEVKKALVGHPGIKALSFAGSLKTTEDVLTLASHASLQNFKKIQISTGSKNSAVVLTAPGPDFNDILNSFLIGQGQLVWNSSRLFILEKFETEWEEALRAYLAALKPSEGIEDTSVWGPCIKDESFTKFDEIRKIAAGDQAKLLQAPFSIYKAFLPPVFTKDMSRCSTLQQDQIHSPFFILSTVKYPFDVAKYSNVSYFGFAAHIWGDKEKTAKVAEAMDVGLVTFNKSSVEAGGPVAAVKQSGFGVQDFAAFGAFYSNVKKMS